MTKPIIFEDFDPKMPCLILELKSITFFGDIDTFLKDVFGIYNRYLRIHKIKRGSIIVTLQFPADIEPQILVCMRLKRKAVEDVAVMHIEYQERTGTQDTNPLPKPEDSVKLEATTIMSEQDNTKVQIHQELQLSKLLSKSPKQFRPIQEATSAAAQVYLKDKTESPKIKPKEVKPKERQIVGETTIASEKEEVETKPQQNAPKRQQPSHLSKQTKTQFYVPQHRSTRGTRLPQGNKGLQTRRLHQTPRIPLHASKTVSVNHYNR